MVGITKTSKTRIIIFSLAAVLLLFGLLEASLRIYQAVNPAFMTVPDTTYLRYRGNPNSDEFNGFKLNSLGYKDVDFKRIKDPGAYRILAIGDSQTYGAVPYNDSYITIVEQQIHRVYPHCEILNMGIPSAGPVDYLSILLNEGFGFNPDMVLLHFNVFDDFKNGGKRFKLYSYSEAARSINSIIANCFSPPGLVFGAGVYREGFSWRSDESYMRMVVEAHGRIFQKNNSSFNKDFQSSISFIQTIKKLCDLKNITLTVVIIPADLQIYPHLQKKVVQILHSNENDFDIRIPNRKLTMEFKRLNIPFIDLLDFFLTRYVKNEASFTQGNDPHWNRYGSRIASNAVSPWLIQQIGRHMHSLK